MATALPGEKLEVPSDAWMEDPGGREPLANQRKPQRTCAAHSTLSSEPRSPAARRRCAATCSATSNSWTSGR